MEFFTVLDMYSGPGGLSKGIINCKYKKSKFKVISATDNDLDVAETYQTNHPSVDFILGDITKQSTKSKILDSIKKQTGTSKVDVVIGGPPCRGFSNANTMTRKKSNPLNRLPLHFIDIIKKTKPFAFIMENVPGMISLDDGCFSENMVSIFKKLGYKNTTFWILNAADYGVPQLRERVFFIGSKNERLALTKPKPTHGDQSLTPYVSLSDVLNDLPYIPQGSSSSPKCGYKHRPKNKFQSKIRKNQQNVKNHEITKSRSITIERFKTVPQGGNWKNIPKRLIQINGKYANMENTHAAIYKRLALSEPSVTITNFRKSMLIHPTQNRLLSVREAARIQSFPDNYEFKGSLNSMQQQVSDAVPIFLSTAVGNSLLKHMYGSLQIASLK